MSQSVIPVPRAAATWLVIAADQDSADGMPANEPDGSYFLGGLSIRIGIWMRLFCLADFPSRPARTGIPWEAGVP